MLKRFSIINSIMNRLNNEKRAQVISCLIEGCSIRSTVRMTGVAMKTVMRVLVEVGEVCADYQDHVFRNLSTRRLQLDEMWAWIYCKEKNRTEEIARKHPDSGDVWLWVAVDADTKLVPSWMLGQRDLGTATAFVSDLASRLNNRVQITTDGHRAYVEAIETAFGMEVDFSILQKIYGSVLENETRYSPAKCIGIDVRHVSGSPDPKHVSTSFIERQNWTVRTKMRRYTRLSISSQDDTRSGTIFPCEALCMWPSVNRGIFTAKSHSRNSINQNSALPKILLLLSSELCGSWAEDRCSVRLVSFWPQQVGQ